MQSLSKSFSGLVDTYSDYLFVYVTHLSYIYIFNLSCNKDSHFSSIVTQAATRKILDAILHRIHQQAFQLLVLFIAFICSSTSLNSELEFYAY